MAKFKVEKNNLGNLKIHIQDIKAKQKDLDSWTGDAAQLFAEEYKHLISIQGENDSMPPPLSSATYKMRNTYGEPDGSGIRDHVKVSYSQSSRRTLTANVYIDDPHAAMVASVQEYGAVIPVTDRMRGKLAYAGIFLKAETTHIRIPGRYAWDKAYKNTINKSKQRLIDKFKSFIKSIIYS